MNGKKYLVAMYLRLSRDDNDIGDIVNIDGNKKTESNSIGTQRELVRTFINNNQDMELYDIYVDDGYTGSNFDRPEFKRMMTDIEAGKVNCVVVKDLSRFGREYIEAGRFLQKTFPALGVRFVAITDNYDSLKADNSESSIIVPVKNFINDSFCRDISIKVKSEQQIKRQNGECIAPFAAYGYLKDPKDNHKLVIDGYAADVVRKIFSWRIDGNSSFSIAQKLNQLGILSPLEYKKFIGLKFSTGFISGTKANWSSIAVTRILKNEIYIGTMVQGKREKVNYKVKKFVDKPSEEWIRVEETHEAIVSREDFERVQNLLMTDVRKSPNKGEENIFKGILFCGDCKEQMVRRVNKYKEAKKVYYICSTKNRGEGCSRHSIEEDTLKKIVFEYIKKYASVFISRYQLIQDAKNLETNFEVIEKYDKQIQKLRAEQDKYYALCSGLYEDLKNGIINKQDFEKFHKLYSDNANDLEIALQSQEELIKKMFKDGVLSGVKLKSFKDSLELEEIDRTTLVSLVNKIFVYENKRIEIEFNYMDVFGVMDSIYEANEKEIEGGALYA